MLTTIKSSLDSLTTSAETKKANKESLLSKFQEELSSEVASLKENILNKATLRNILTNLMSELRTGILAEQDVPSPTVAQDGHS